MGTKVVVRLFMLPGKAYRLAFASGDPVGTHGIVNLYCVFDGLLRLRHCGEGRVEIEFVLKIPAIRSATAFW